MSSKKTLDIVRLSLQPLTMVKSGDAGAAENSSIERSASTAKAEQTRGTIFQAALQLFREQGFDGTTMQQIAERAGVVKSAAYYYFPGKDAIIAAYYETVQAAQERLCAEAFATTKKLQPRLKLALHSKLDLASDDRNLLGVVFRYTGEPHHALSCLGRGTEEMRRRATDIFREAIAEEKLPPDLRELLPLALWTLQMGLTVMFLYDESPGQRRTRKLADGALELTLKLLVLAKLPVLKPVRKRILELLRDAALLPEAQA